MELNVSEEILAAYGLSKAGLQIIKIGSGHINRTFLLSQPAENQQYILQEINTSVFKFPEAISRNITKVSAYLKKDHPEYLFPSPIATLNGEAMVVYENEYWRLFPYIEETVALDALFEPKQAYEAAKQFGKLSRLLNDFPAQELEETIPGFHNLNLRYSQFTEALNNGAAEWKAHAADVILKAKEYRFVIDYYNSFLLRPDFKDRVMHHDTKISNVLLHKGTYDGICVIDLDTLMPGKFISDLGDMMRTYLSAFTENETDLKKITIRIPYFEAMIGGYLSEMGNVLTDTEKELILFSGKYIIYMQALRFLTDYLNGSIYYPITYKAQNLDRAKNQFKLLSEIYDNENILQDIITENLNKHV